MAKRDAEQWIDMVRARPEPAVPRTTCNRPADTSRPTTRPSCDFPLLLTQQPFPQSYQFPKHGQLYTTQPGTQENPCLATEPYTHSKALLASLSQRLTCHKKQGVWVTTETSPVTTNAGGSYLVRIEGDNRSWRFRATSKCKVYQTNWSPV